MQIGQPAQAARSRTAGDWLRERLVPRGENVLLLASYTIILMALVTFILQRYGELPVWRFYGTLLALATLLVLNMALPEMEALVPSALQADWAYLLVAAALFLLAFWLGEGETMVYIIFMLNAQAVVALRLREALGYSIGVVGAWLALLWTRGVPPATLSEIATAVSLGIVFTSTVALVIVRYAEQRVRAETLLQQLQAANAELVAAREREKELAAAEERVRLAREIHDGLGHHLTVLNVQLQAAARLMDRDATRAADVIAICREEAQAALDEVRRSVAAMRQSPLDGRSLEEALETLVRDFDRHSPVAARFEQRGTSVPLVPVAAMTLYRAAQEGLTNAQKHAAARHVTVTLDLSPAAVRLTVANDGTGRAPSSGGGFGLAGLRERAEQLGGSLTAGPRPEGGFLLAMMLPVTEEDRR